VRGKANYDLQTLKTLIGQTVSDNDYEYLNGDDAYNDEASRITSASTLDDYQQIDDQLVILLDNINAMLTNLKDPNYDNHVYRNVLISKTETEPFNRVAARTRGLLGTEP